MDNAPLFVPVILGTSRQGRQSEYVAKFSVEQISQRENVETELIDIRNIAIAQRLRLNQSTFISPGVVTIPEQTLGFKQGILVRDRDGHTMRLVER